MKTIKIIVSILWEKIGVRIKSCFQDAARGASNFPYFNLGGIKWRLTLNNTALRFTFILRYFSENVLLTMCSLLEKKKDTRYMGSFNKFAKVFHTVL